jgi:3-oxoacyl-[acyl-carrier protein] reductase
MSFTGKCILVTGASGGIGSAIIQHLVHLGATVGIHYYRETEEVLNTIEIIQRTSPNSIALQADLTNWDESKDLVTRFVNHTGQIDGLVNNAGAIWAYGAFDSISEQDWDKTYAVNVRAAFETMTSAWEYFVAQNGGRVVNISSASVGYNGSLRSVHYISAKAALESVSKVFAKDGAKHNILVNVLRLGLMDTPMHFRTPGYTREHLDSRAEIVPLGRMGSPSEAAKWVAMLLGEDGSFMTGQIIGLTGGD